MRSNAAIRRNKSKGRPDPPSVAPAAAGVADLLLAAPFYRTVVGTDTYVDEL